MAFYEASIVTSVVTATAGTPIAALRGVTRPLRVYEVGMSAITAPTTSGALALYRSTTLGVTPAGTQTGFPMDTGNAIVTASGLVVQSWTTAPVIAANPIRRFVFPPSIGAGLIWTWPPGREPIIPGGAGVGSELVVVNLQSIAPGTWEIYMAWEE